MYLLLHFESPGEKLPAQWVYHTEGDRAVVQAALDKTADKDAANWRCIETTGMPCRLVAKAEVEEVFTV